jgi:HEAT repeat protein
MRLLSLAVLLSCAAVLLAQDSKPKPDKQIDELLEQLDKKTTKLDIYGRVAAAKSLGAYGARAEKALPALVDLRSVVGTASSVKAVDDAIDRITLAMIAHDKRDTSLAELAVAIGDKEPDVRLRSIKYFATIQDSTLSRIAKAAGDDKDEDVRHLAGKTVRKADLALRKAPANVEHLVADLKDEDASIRLRAAKKLGMLGDKAASAAPALTASAKDDKDDDVKRVAADALKRIEKK